MRVFRIIALSFNLFIIFLFVSCNTSQSSNVSVTSEEYAVYSAIFKAFAGGNAKTLLINKETSFSMRMLFLPDDESPNEEELVSTLEGFFPQVGKSTIKNYVSKNLKHSILENKIKLPVKYVLFDKAKLKSEEEVLSELHEKYPQSITGYINLSRVGFNKDKT